MAYIDKITLEEKVSDGMSPAEVSKCQIGGKSYYLKKISNVYSRTTYSIRREAEMMQWLNERLNVPHVLEYGIIEHKEYLIMSEIKGVHIDDFVKQPLTYIKYLVKSIKELQKVDISKCSFFSKLDVRLEELRFLMDNKMADVDLSNWQDTTEFSDPEVLYQWLFENRPEEELCFSHGDIGANFFVAEEEIVFYDLGRCGVADKWVDIAFCVRDIREYYPDSDYEKMFFELLGIEPDYEKINYYILLDEMF